MPETDCAEKVKSIAMVFGAIASSRKKPCVSVEDLLGSYAAQSD